MLQLDIILAAFLAIEEIGQVISMQKDLKYYLMSSNLFSDRFVAVYMWFFLQLLSLKDVRGSDLQINLSYHNLRFREQLIANGLLGIVDETMQTWSN